jgi:hypothetical protein
MDFIGVGFTQFCKNATADVVSLDIVLIKFTGRLSILETLVEQPLLLVALRAVRVILTFARVDFLPWDTRTMALV